VSSITKIPSGWRRSGQVRAIGSGEPPVVPRALVDELLEGLLRVLDVESRREVDAAGERLDALALASWSSLGDRPRSRWLRLVREVVAEDVGIIPEPVDDFGSQFRCVSLAHTDHTNKGPREFVGPNGVVLDTYAYPPGPPSRGEEFAARSKLTPSRRRDQGGCI